MSLDETYIKLLEDQHAEVEAELKAEIVSLKEIIEYSFWDFLDSNLDSEKKTSSDVQYQKYCTGVWEWWTRRPFVCPMPNEIWNKIMKGKDLLYGVDS